jgi:predicted Fe-Mo cluster-binding NifX family protein
MDANLDSDLIVKIKKSLEEVQGVKGVDDLKIRQSGPFKMVDCIIKTKSTLTLYKSHEVADVAENQLLNQYQNIESVFIHVEPQKETIKTAAIPVQDKNGLDSKLHGYFGRAPYFIIVKLINGQVSFDRYLSNEFLDKKGHIGLNIVKLMISHKINLLFISRIGEISFHMLKNNFVDIVKVDRDITIKEIIDLYLKDKLEAIVEPNVAKQNF